MMRKAANLSYATAQVTIARCNYVASVLCNPLAYAIIRIRALVVTR